MNREKTQTIDSQAAKQISPVASVLSGASRFEKYATTQAAGDGIEGDVRKKHKTQDENLGAQMPDRK
jgi:hypothetical protein